MSSKSFSKHDHTRCITSALNAAEAYCASKGVQLTHQRRRVLELLLEEHRAMGAYEILDRLREDGMSAQPPVAYRALDFLVKHGFAHRIERLNAFIACAHPSSDKHAPAFLICRVCNSVAETEADTSAGRLGLAAEDAGFRIEATVLEAEGICPNCVERPAR